MLIKLKGDRHAESNNHEESREKNHYQEDRGKEEHCEKNYEEEQVKDLLLTCRRYFSLMKFRDYIAAELSPRSVREAYLKPFQERYRRKNLS